MDFDHCLDAAGSLLEPFATWYKTMPGYWELSQSGTGLHGFVHGTLPAGCGNKRPICPGDKTDKREVELYIKERYIAMTGALWGPQTPLADAPSAQAGIDAIIEQTGLLKGNGPADTLPEIDDRPAEELDAILQSALQRDLDFAQLYTNTDHSGDESTADHALVCAACRAVNFKLSAGDLQRILDASPWVTTKDAKHLQKWQERTDYAPRTIREAWAASATKEADKMEGFKSLAPEKPRFVTQMADRGSSIDEQKVDYTISIVNEHPQEAKESLAELDRDIICHTMSGKPIKPKTVGQRTYVNSIEKSMIVFGVGPAGTGKTYLAMAKAITAFKNNEVGRIILTRPAIEAGEKLGFLPGDLQSKVDPYLRPLYDALYEIMGADAFMKNMEKGLIEVAPLAYMRGRTLDNAYIVLDEAQNTTPAQMKMFLTRIGFGSKAIITGDLSQKDLPHDAQSGLDVALKVLKDIDDISICHLTSLDVVRHPLVQKIVNAYEKYEDKRSRQAKPRKTTTAQKNRGK